MSQTTTRRGHPATLHGHMASASPRDTEGMVIPVDSQVLRVTAGPDDPVAAGDYNVAFRLTSGGPLITLATAYTSPGEPAATFATNFAAAMAADLAFRSYFRENPIVAAGLNIDLTLRSSVAEFEVVSVTQPAGNNVSAAQLSPSGGAALPISVLYAYKDPFTVSPDHAVQGNQRRGFPARPVQAGDVLSDLRGVVAREPLSTTQDGNFFQPGEALDQYQPGATFPGLKRGVVDVLIDPNSGAIDDTFLQPLGAPALYVVLATGLNAQVGALTTVVDGGNTLQVNTNVNGDTFLRPIMPEGNNPVSIGGETRRSVRCMLNRLN